MLLNMSMLIVFIYTVLCIMYVQANRHLLANMTGTVVAMTTGLMSNLTIGVILGMLFAQNLVMSTGISILFCFLIGYMVGRPLGLLAIIEGIGGGIMGGVHGAMLGEMIPIKQWDAMLFIMDAMYIAVTALVVYLIHDRKHREEQPAAAVKAVKAAKDSFSAAPVRTSFWMIYIVLPVVVLCVAAWLGHSPSGWERPSPGHDMHSM
ncbi:MULTISPECIES: hypothetical protein [Paenibacillus]|uniref:Uncharacterized protein n=1 Tax=Paenibacillus albilobatus TaxID=2716884 RepID=A0A920CET3_9BACL|nr:MULTISPECIES: hypothetical protein [Paenibacillus]MDR9857048.1 hypothetical protein [Paenibacillus sp. VCA1]GIO34254.1 hypothetical protein J2TS6_53950 [Paenibacillus albilobatus]